MKKILNAMKLKKKKKGTIFGGQPKLQFQFQTLGA
jgi:hypothetical protein